MNIRNIAVFILLILMWTTVHECGHIFMAILTNSKIDSIVIELWGARTRIVYNPNDRFLLGFGGGLFTLLTSLVSFKITTGVIRNYCLTLAIISLVWAIAEGVGINGTMLLTLLGGIGAIVSLLLPIIERRVACAQIS